MVSILLLKETPVSCDYNCPCCEIEEGFWGDITTAKCRKCNKNVIGYIGIKRPDWCPLTSLPKRMSKETPATDFTHPLTVYSQGVHDGGDMCLDEIEGELND